MILETRHCDLHFPNTLFFGWKPPRRAFRLMEHQFVKALSR